MEIKKVGCPGSNFRKGRPGGHRPEAIVVHIMDGSLSGGESVFLNSATQKSAHYGVSTTGEVHEYVDEGDTAFHAGIVVRPKVTSVHVLKNVNVRTGAPNVSAPIARVILAGTKVDVAGIHGRAKRCRE